ncbi:MAG TPA: HAMP domain-containing sensor histidine kinase [Acidimicrobiales bacterium]|nr:HAMP domain-containing sensor histidine kinase [Acidimicrobiales bacterium]
MRRRLTVALVSMVVATLALTVAGSLILIQRSTISSQKSELLTETEAAIRVLSTPLSTPSTTLPADARHPRIARARAVARERAALRVLERNLQRIGNYRDLVRLKLSDDGSVSPAPPAPITPAMVQPGNLTSGKSVTGSVGSIVFAVVPYGSTSSETLALLVTRTVKDPLSGLGYFLIVSAVVLVLAILVAAYLSRRITRPLVRAVATTKQIAEGDLLAKVPITDNDYPELLDLAQAINSMSESISRARGLERQFLLSVSHELRTPLTSIRGYADALAEGATNDIPGAVRIIDQEARRLERLVRDLLDLARLDSRQFTFDIHQVSCSEVLRAQIEGQAPEAASLGLELVDRVAPGDALWVEADTDRLSQVIANLVENAFKYAVRHVEIGAMRSASSIELWVEDDGPGISPEDLPHVFDRHFRSDRSATRRLGTGLGLAIVFELAAGMGGQVRALSPAIGEHGTRMSVTFNSTSGEAHTLGPTPRFVHEAPSVG